MSKKKNKIIIIKDDTFNLPANQRTYRDMKRMCIVRGMDFEELLRGDFTRLHSWLHKNWGNKINEELLTKFDDWMDEELLKGGNADLIHPNLRLGYISDGREDENEGSNKIKKKEKTEPKVKKEKTEDGIFSGTKKALTYSLQKAGESLEDTITKVIEKFPDASDKSIKIWFKKCKRENEKTSKK